MNQIDRLRADAALQQIQLMASATSTELYAEQVKALQGQVGQIYIWEKAKTEILLLDPETGLDPEFDRAGLQALRSEMSAV